MELDRLITPVISTVATLLGLSLLQSSDVTRNIMVSVK